jgi:glycosyltransferase involved in cell wall biosynthesis
MKKLKLHVIQSDHQLDIVSFVESPTMRRSFEISKSSELPKNDVDLIYCQTYTSPYIISKLETSDVPLVLHVQGDVWYELSEIHQKYDLLNRVNRLCRKAAAVVCISRFLGQQAIQGIPGTENICYLPGGFWGLDHTKNGIQPQAFCPEKEPRDFEKPLSDVKFLMQMNLTLPRKYSGISVMFEALQKHLPLAIACFGSYRPSEIQFKDALVSHYGIAWNKQVDHWHAVLPKYDCYLHPSLYDTFGRSVAEAMSAGLPVLAFNAGGVPEVSDRVLFCDPNDSDEILAKFEQLVSDPKFAYELGQELRSDALRKTEAHRNDYRDLLISLVTKGEIPAKFKMEAGT